MTRSPHRPCHAAPRGLVHRSSSSSSNAAAGEGRDGQHQRRNAVLLRRLEGSRRCEARLHWRNAVVVSNLALVRLVASRESRRTGRPYDELYASGCLGLIRAVEGFDAGRGVALSTFAVPYIRGAMLQEQRDRDQPVHTPRRLRELQRRAEKLVEQRRCAGLAALGPAQLAAALGCSLERLEEAGRVKRALQVGSLDRPAPGCDGEGEALSLLDRVAAPRRPGGGDSADPQLGWLRRQLRRLAPAERELLEGRWIDGLSWRELALLQGCPAAACRERAGALLNALGGQARAAGAAGSAQASPGEPQASIASRAARAV